MNEKGKVRAHLEFGGAKVDFEGDADQVLKSILRFLSQVYPSIRAFQKIVYTPDLIKISNEIAGLMEITSDGPIINPNIKIGKLQKETLSTSELSRFTGKAKKTVSNELPKLVDKGLVEKVAEGEYKITQLGIRKAEEIAGVIREKMNLG